MSDIEHRERYNSSSFSVIGEDAVYSGDVEFEGVLHINGDFYGNIKGNGDLGIGLSGRVRSVIYANNVLISGLVCGNVFALGRVGIKSSAIVIGNICASSLVVEEGSILQGKLEILDSEERRAVVKPNLSHYKKRIVKEVDEVNSGELREENSKDLPLRAEEPEKRVVDSSRKDKYSVWK